MLFFVGIIFLTLLICHLRIDVHINFVSQLKENIGCLVQEKSLGIGIIWDTASGLCWC